jgi:hypothetical protein
MSVSPHHCGPDSSPFVGTIPRHPVNFSLSAVETTLALPDLFMQVEVPGQHSGREEK